MRTAFERKLRSVWLRCNVNLFIEQAGKVAAIAGMVAAAGILTQRLFALSVINSKSLWIFAGAAGVCCIVLWLIKRPSKWQAARLLDERMKLHERFSTTLAMAGSDDPFAVAAREEAYQKAEYIEPKKYFPIKASKSWGYAGGIWALTAIAVLWMPQMDMLGYLRAKEDAQEKTKQTQIAQQEVKDAVSAVKVAVRGLDNQELDAKLAALGDSKGDNPEILKLEAIKKLGDIGESIKKMQSETQTGSSELKEMMKQLKGSSDDVSQKLRQALAQGNFDQASNLLKEMQKQMIDGKLSEEQKKNLSQQLQQLASELEQLAKKNEQLKNELQKLGLDKKLAQMDPEQLKKALEKQGLSAEKIQQLLQKQAACKSACSKCSGLGKAMAACGGENAGLSADELAAVAGKLDELELAKQQAMLSQAQLDEIERAISCLGQGMCKGPGCQGPFREGLAEKEAAGTGGPGRGFGSRNSDTEGQTANKPTRVENQSKEGPVIASWYFKGTQDKGAATKPLTEVIQAGRDSAAEAINENQIPKKYEEPVKKYFGQLEESGVNK